MTASNDNRDLIRSAYVEGFRAGVLECEGIVDDSHTTDAEGAWRESASCRRLAERAPPPDPIAEDRAEWDAAPRW